MEWNYTYVQVIFIVIIFTCAIFHSVTYSKWLLTIAMISENQRWITEIEKKMKHYSYIIDDNYE